MDNEGLGLMPLFGWVDGPLDPVDPPLCGESPASSHDPVFPGVLVMWPHKGLKHLLQPRPDSAPILFVGTNTFRTREMLNDGCGFAMVATAVTEDRCLSGDWRLWGIRRGGEGSFTLCPI